MKYLCKFVRFVGLILLPLQGDLFGWALLPRALPRADVFNPYRVLGNLKRLRPVTAGERQRLLMGLGRSFQMHLRKFLRITSQGISDHSYRVKSGKIVLRNKVCVFCEVCGRYRTHYNIQAQPNLRATSFRRLRSRAGMVMVTV